MSSKEYMKAYRIRNRKKLSAQVQSWKKTNHEHFRQKEREYYNTPEGKAKHVARATKTHRAWLSHLLSAAQSHSIKPGPHDPKDPIRREFNIDLDYICEIWDLQSGRCALTNLPMTYTYNDMRAVSIDRIDSAKGHIRDNIQLVCQAVNRMKNNHDNEDVKNFIMEIKHA